MARQEFYASATRVASGIALAAGATYVVYTDTGGTVLANISATSGGSAISGSTIASDANGVLNFFGPPGGANTLYVRCPALPFGVQRIDALADPRLDRLEGLLPGAPTDGGSHLLSSQYGTLGAAVAAFPDVAGLALSDQFDYAVLQQALTTATANSELHISAGANYQINKALTVTVDGLRITGPGTITQLSNLTCIFLVTADAVTIDGLELAGPGSGDTSNLPTSYGSAAIFKETNRGAIRNCLILNCSGSGGSGGAGVWLTGATDVTVEGNTIAGTKIGINTDGFYGVSWENTISNNRMVSCARGYVNDLTGPNSATSYGDIVTGNRVDQGSANGLEFDDCQNGFTCTDNSVRDGTNGIVVLHRSRDFTIANNRIWDASLIGILLNNVDSGYYIQDGAILGNRARGCQDGMQLYQCLKLEILGNQFVLNTRDGVLIPDGETPRQVKFIGNSVNQNENYGLDLADVIDWKIIGNSIYNNGTATSNTYSGIRITRTATDPKRVTVAYNDFFASDSGYTETQKYAVEYTATVGSRIKLAHNEFGTQATAAVADAWGGIERFHNGGESASKRVATSRRTAGNFTPASTSWADLTSAMDLVLTAQAGDMLLLTLNGFWSNENLFGYLDAATIVSGSPVNYASSGSGTQAADGLTGWTGPNGSVYTPIGGSAVLTVAAGDLVNGQVTLRLRVKCSGASTKTLFAQTNDPLIFSATNLGP